MPTADPMPYGALAAALADAIASQDLLFIAADEQRAERIAAALTALAPDAKVVHLPSSDAIPGDDAPPSAANVGRRVGALRRLRLLATDRNRPRLACITTAEATVPLLPPVESFDAAPPALAVGDELDPEAFRAEAEAIGYFTDDRVDEPGEVAVRGGVVDIFPADSPRPVRIEVVEGRIAAIRCYDPATQRSEETLERIEIGRAMEPGLGEGATGVSLFAHLPPVAIASDPGAGKRRARFLALAEDGARRRRSSAGIVPEEDWKAELAKADTLALPEVGDVPPRFVEQRQPSRGFARFGRAALEGGALLLVGSRRDLRFLGTRVKKLLKTETGEVASWQAARKLGAGKVATLVAPIERGFRVEGLAVVAASDLLGGRALAEDSAVAAIDPLFAGAGELRIGDVVVHEDFGIGAVLGLETLPGDAGDAIVLGYAREGRRLVPVAEADRIWRYGADADSVTLDSLDGSSWEKRRGAIDAAVAESAKGLAALAAERDARTTDPIEPDPSAYERFAAGFAFTETPDQARAIAAVRDDLGSGKPMDRLVIGDVGYGKTEVALRAAAMVALAGRQVAIAAPTTVLVRQHLETFQRRFEGTGIAVAGLSRLSSEAEKKQVKAGLADGSVRVVIGTGAVAGAGVDYDDLALVVIDEEQRFGAADKAKLRDLGAGHVMALSATPIPRTLQTALVGLQQLSILATPPARRQPIRTAIASFDPVTVRSALLREKGRGGQSFVVVPRIEGMAPLEAELKKLVPELRLVTAHGKMPAAEIDEAMVAFANGAGDVLLATNIIEAGLDVPRANTMIVHHADRFGLSQLHQLRGRVGRGGRRGQVLLMTEAGAEIAESTLKRLRTLQAFDRLGAGFAISARDLDMRGAGDLMGEAQAGHMKLIGVDLYQHLLGLALRSARGEEVAVWTPELNLGIEGRLPEDWIPEAEVRLTLYARLARLTDEAALDGFEEELEDRFGELPEDAQRLMTVARIRQLARVAEVARVDAGPGGIALTPYGKAKLKAEGLEAKGDRYVLAERIEDAAERAVRVQALLSEVGDC
ncbi:helicase-related protein [Sphingomonas desiccabilis]|nr:helicase-related protein [Sphingomonas desiccabilis]MBB3912464.1 transcription-repair coupling factor (superfamily II helicase) [Sphingomonas desiccabilis]